MLGLTTGVTLFSCFTALINGAAFVSISHIFNIGENSVSIFTLQGFTKILLRYMGSRISSKDQLRKNCNKQLMDMRDLDFQGQQGTKTAQNCTEKLPFMVKWPFNEQLVVQFGHYNVCGMLLQVPLIQRILCRVVGDKQGPECPAENAAYGQYVSRDVQITNGHGIQDSSGRKRKVFVISQC